jgi:hypothetical protein
MAAHPIYPARNALETASDAPCQNNNNHSTSSKNQDTDEFINKKPRLIK